MRTLCAAILACLRLAVSAPAQTTDSFEAAERAMEGVFRGGDDPATEQAAKALLDRARAEVGPDSVEAIRTEQALTNLAREQDAGRERRLRDDPAVQTDPRIRNCAALREQHASLSALTGGRSLSLDEVQAALVPDEALIVVDLGLRAAEAQRRAMLAMIDTPPDACWSHKACWVPSGLVGRPD